MQVGPLEVLVILVLALLVFGPNKLPELARTVGKGMREVRRLQRMVQSELDDAMSEPTPGPRRPGQKSEAGTESAGNGASGNGASGNGASGERPVRAEEPGSDAKPDSDRDDD
ncbi:MAG: twin-arginine translocase TatA/TatE family subunit [Acidimicrobiia bacterium]